MTLEETLRKAGQTRWLDIGCGVDLDPSFEGVDLFPKTKINERARSKYHRLNVLKAGPVALKRLGKFDLIRMQHVFEHFSFEEGQLVLTKCAQLLKKGGYIVITVPDLRVYIQKYLNDEFKRWPEFVTWANLRVTEGAPNSAYFSYFAHSSVEDPHKWCYDYEGLAFQLQRTGQFTDIRDLKPGDDLASTPFIHNRPAEDACAVAQKI
jgi:SAM-dependent methyltransferase